MDSVDIASCCLSRQFVGMAAVPALTVPAAAGAIGVGFLAADIARMLAALAGAVTGPPRFFAPHSSRISGREWPKFNREATLVPTAEEPG
jgi:hypothetical protein